MAVYWMPGGYHSVTPFFHVRDVTRLTEFLKAAFDAEQAQLTRLPEGRVVHAEVRIGDSRVMLGEPWGGAEIPPGTHHAYVYVPDVDPVYRRALGAGASSVMEPADQVWGDRLAGVEDPSGVRWWIATHRQEVVPAPPRHW